MTDSLFDIQSKTPNYSMKTEVFVNEMKYNVLI